jgi:hypothetical protein
VHPAILRGKINENIFRLFPISDQHLYLSISTVVTWYQGLHSGLKKDEDKSGTHGRILQLSRISKNITRMLTTVVRASLIKLLEPHLSVGKKK